SREDVENVTRAIGDATRPLLVAGRGCRAPAVATWLRAFAEALPAPVLVTPAGRGALPDPHPLCHGLLAHDAALLRRADLVLALESATPCWQAVQPGEVLVDDDVLGASVAVARERPEFLVLAFAILGDEARALGTRAGVRIITPAPAALDQTLAAEASAADPR